MHLGVVHGLAHCLNLLSIFVRNRPLELVFELHNLFDKIERIRPEILTETRLRDNLLGANTQ